MKSRKKQPASTHSGRIELTSATGVEVSAVEAFYGDKDVRMTAVEFGPKIRMEPRSIEHYVDWALKDPAFLAESDHMLVLLPWLKSTESTIVTFWESYRDLKLQRARIDACRGSKFRHCVAEAEVLCLDGMLSAYENPGVPADPKIIRHIKSDMVAWLRNAIRNEPKALKRLYDLLRNPNSSKFEDAGTEALEGRIFREFVHQVLMNFELPSKKALRVGVRLGDGQNAYRQAAGAFTTLGLGGLPKG